MWSTDPQGSGDKNTFTQTTFEVAVHNIKAPVHLPLKSHLRAGLRVGWCLKWMSVCTRTAFYNLVAECHNSRILESQTGPTGITPQDSLGLAVHRCCLRIMYVWEHVWPPCAFPSRQKVMKVSTGKAYWSVHGVKKKKHPMSITGEMRQIPSTCAHGLANIIGSVRGLVAGEVSRPCTRTSG